MTPTLIAIAGASGSGKTTLAQQLARLLGSDTAPAPVINLDRYYRDYSHLELHQRAAINFDHPDSLNLTRFAADLRAWRKGGTVAPPGYDFTQHRPLQAGERVHAAPVMIVEGILVLHTAALRELFQVSLFIDTPLEVCLSRRIERDVRERGRSRESVITQFSQTVMPMTQQYVLPQQDYADVTLTPADQPAVIVETIRQHLSNTLCQHL
ncbi:uridine kinase [Gilvimarinus agarilyticus]|uniref:uridine kinase n=1 Tax=Gilvimarinus agarilyticus TaxID=679259 RepID=UPI0005A102FE|nr:uridine kinase [Gilvimarinus agarilyticus]